MKKNKKSIIGILMLSMCLIILSSNTNNMPWGFTGAPTEGLCTDCHSVTGGNAAEITLTGLPAEVFPNTSYQIDIHMELAIPVSAPFIGGMELTAIDQTGFASGIITENDNFLGIEWVSVNGRQYLKHEQSQFANGGDVDWSFTWTSPSDIPPGGQVSFYLTACMGNLSQSAAGDYCVDEVYTISVVPVPVMAVVIEETESIDCFGSASASLTAEAVNGIEPYTYVWSNGAVGPVLSNVQAGTYNVSAVDVQGNVAIQSYQVLEPAPLFTQLVVSEQPLCPDDASGTVLAIASGGTAPYTYSWADGFDGDTYTNASVGVYQVLITDSNGCIGESSIILSSSDTEAPSLIADIELTLSADANTGATDVLNIEASMLFPFLTDDCSVSISSISPSAFSCDHLGSNTFEFIAFDDVGNTAFLSGTVVVSDEAAPMISCPADTLIANCTAAFEYEVLTSDWCDSDLTMVQGLASGSVFPSGLTDCVYQAVDPSGNVSTCSFTVEVAEGPEIVLESIMQPCFGEESGMISVSVNSASAYSIEWSNGESGLSIENLAQGLIELTITDENFCSTEASFELIELDDLTVDLDSMLSADLGAANGALYISLTQNYPDLDISWLDEQGTVIQSADEDLLNVSAGIYQFVALDTINGCSFSFSFEVEEESVFSRDIYKNLEEIYPYPNPAQDRLFLSNLRAGEVYFYELMDAKGRLLDKGSLGTSGIDVSSFYSGVYFIRLRYQEDILIRTFIKF